MQFNGRIFNLSTVQNAVCWLAVHLAIFVVVGLFLAIVGHVISIGISNFNVDFLLQPTSQSGRSGGIGPIIVSTVWIVGICIGVTVPVGLGAAVFLSEFSQRSLRLKRIVGRSMDLLAGMPSIVFGLFGNVFFCKVLGLGFSILSGGLTLACMALPLFIRSTELGLRAVPADYRLGSLALGYSLFSSLWHVILPVALPGIVAGLVLGIGRALAETAALIFTSGYVDRMPESVMDSGRALSVHIYDLSMNIPGGDQNAYKSAFVLIVLILVINFTAAFFMKHILSNKIGAK